MFSVDYPFARDAQGRKFLDEVALAPADMAKLCHGNADALLKLKAIRALLLIALMSAACRCAPRTSRAGTRPGI